MHIYRFPRNPSCIYPITVVLDMSLLCKPHIYTPTLDLVLEFCKIDIVSLFQFETTVKQNRSFELPTSSRTLSF